MTTVMATAKVTACDVAKRMGNAMGTLRASFRRYVVNAWNNNLPETPSVTRMPNTSCTFCRLLGTPAISVEDGAQRVDVADIVI